MIALLISLLLSVFISSPVPAEQLPSRGGQIVEGIAAIVTVPGREPTRELILYSDLERHRYFFAPLEEEFNLSQGLNQVIHQRLLRPEARRFILNAPPKDVIQERLKKIRKRFESDDTFELVLRQTGLIESELKEEIREYLWVEQLLEERIKGFVFVSPKTIEDYFEGHTDFFEGRTLAEVSKQIESFLMMQKERVKKKEYLQRIKAKAEIEILLK